MVEGRVARIEEAVNRQLAAGGSDGTERRRDIAKAHARYRARLAARERLDGEYHQARVLLLVSALAGESGALDGLTKLAKLDFLLRYPMFLERIVTAEGDVLPDPIGPSASERSAVESRMIRYKYGPWDERYYGVIGALVGRGLVEYSKSASGRVSLKPTSGGRAIAAALASDPTWAMASQRAEYLHERYGRLSGNRIKELIYDRLPDVVDRPHRTEI